jgi:diacylglycerol kinase (ATP)
MHADYLIVANLMSGKGEAERRMQEVKMTVNSHDESCEIIEIREPKRISKIVLKDLHINSGVVCIGGDGTVSETVGLMINNEIDVPLKIIPTGTANIIGNTLGVGGDSGNKGDKEEITQKIIDVGLAEYGKEKEYFLLGIGLGFEEKFIELAKKGLKTKLGPLSYIFTALRELLTIKPITIKLVVDNKTIDANVALLVAFNLQPKILKAFPLFPYKEIKSDDGLLNVFCVEYRNKFQAILGTLVFHILGRINFGLVKQIVTNNVSITSPLPCRTQIDGEIRGELPVKLNIKSISLKVKIS